MLISRKGLIATVNSVSEKIVFYGGDILTSEKMLEEKNFIQHGSITCYEHSVNVAEKSVFIAETLSFRINERALIRGALLHDYFLYDWHHKGHRLHGFFHAKAALKNASRDFSLSEIEEDIIKRHMFPLNIRPPKYAESWVVCFADKLCAAEEFFSGLSVFFANLV